MENEKMSQLNLEEVKSDKAKKSGGGGKKENVDKPFLLKTAKVGGFLHAIIRLFLKCNICLYIII